MRCPVCNKPVMFWQKKADISTFGARKRFHFDCANLKYPPRKVRVPDPGAYEIDCHAVVASHGIHRLLH